MPADVIQRTNSLVLPVTTLIVLFTFSYSCNSVQQFLSTLSYCTNHLIDSCWPARVTQRAKSLVLSVTAQNVVTRLPTQIIQCDDSIVLSVTEQTRWIIYAIQNTNPPDSEVAALTPSTEYECPRDTLWQSTRVLSCRTVLRIGTRTALLWTKKRLIFEVLVAVSVKTCTYVIW
jgi:hypothetical protein